MLNSNPMTAKLKILGIFVNSGSKVNFKVKHNLSSKEARSKCYNSPPHFLVILTGQSISEFIWNIQGNIQGKRSISRSSKR